MSRITGLSWLKNSPAVSTARVSPSLRRHKQRTCPLLCGSRSGGSGGSRLRCGSVSGLQLAEQLVFLSLHFIPKTRKQRHRRREFGPPCSASLGCIAYRTQSVGCGTKSLRTNTVAIFPHLSTNVSPTPQPTYRRHL